MLNSQISLAQQSVNIARTHETQPLANNLVAILMDDRVRQAESILAVSLAMFAICLWIVRTYKVSKNGGTRPKAKELIPALLLILLLSANINDLVFTTKNTMKNLNAPVHKVVAEDSLRSAVQQGQSQLSTTSLLDDPYINPHIKRIISQYQIDF